MSGDPQQVVKRSPGSGAIELTISAKAPGVDAINCRQLLPAPGCALVGPFVAFEHFRLAIESHRPGVSLALNTSVEAVSMRYTFGIPAGQADTHGAAHVQHHSILCWIAAPGETFEQQPGTAHVEPTLLPTINIAGTTVRVVLGYAFGQESPVMPFRHGHLLECNLPDGSVFNVPQGQAECAVYVAHGVTGIDGQKFEAGTLAVTARGWPVKLVAVENSVVFVIGGNPPSISKGSPRWSW